MPEVTAAPPQKRLGELLVDAGLLAPDQLDHAVERARAEGRRLGAYLADEGLVAAEDIARTLSLQLNVPLIDLKSHAIQKKALDLVSEEYARQNDLIPIEIDGGALVVVMADPGSVTLLEDLKAGAKMAIRPAVGITADIREAINRNYRASAAIEEQISRVAPPITEEAPEEVFAADITAQTPVVRTVDLLIAQAIRDRASDIHLEPQKGQLRVRYRIDGILREVQSLPLSVHPAIVSRLKVLAGMNIAERRRPQDGQFSIEIEGKDVDFRVATTDSAHGEMAVLRVLDKSLSLFALDQIGFQPESLERYARMLRSPFGMILVAGPTGSGKTTTLYASVNSLDRNERNIITIEDPIEYQFDGINQIQVQPRAGITFASGLRSVMRLDPDVILVGEVRDGETAKMAIQAALTGHLVLSSIHANDAVGVLFRLQDLDVEPFLISSALVGIVAQRMVRRVCPHCRDTCEPAPEEEAAYEEEIGEKPASVSCGTGCNFCSNTGYLGRTGVFEVLTASDDMRRLLLKNASSVEMKDLAVSEGMISMRHDGMLKAKQGVTRPQEVIRNVYTIS